MTVREWARDFDFKAMAVSVAIGLLSLIALMLLIDRFERVARSQNFKDSQWTAPSGTELRLVGIDEGPLVTVETSPGEGLTIEAAKARLTEDGPLDHLVWMSRGKGDNKSSAQFSLIGENGSVSLSRSGDAQLPQLTIKVENASLYVESGVAIGPSLAVPDTIVDFGREEISPGRAFSFIVPPGGRLFVQLPTFPNGMLSGTVTGLGAVRDGQGDALLSVREIGLARDEAATPDKSICATNRRFAWGMLARPVLFPVPHGEDCDAGALNATSLEFERNSITVALVGSGWQLENGKPTESLWSWAKSNEVLSLVINDVLPAAVSLILGFFVWRRRTSATAPAGESGAPATVPAGQAMEGTDGPGAGGGQ